MSQLISAAFAKEWTPPPNHDSPVLLAVAIAAGIGLSVLFEYLRRKKMNGGSENDGEEETQNGQEGSEAEKTDNDDTAG